MIVRRIGRTGPQWSSPFNDFDRIRREMFRFLDAFPGDYPPGDYPAASAGIFPAINVSQDRDNFYVRAELPGVKPDALDVSAVNRTLTISGKRSAPEESGVSYHRKERVDGDFSRSVTMPGDFDNERVEARFANGVLNIQLPKPEKAKPRHISVKST